MLNYIYDILYMRFFKINKIMTSYIFTKDVLLLLVPVFQSFKINNRPGEETGDSQTAFCLFQLVLEVLEMWF